LSREPGFIANLTFFADIKVIQVSPDFFLEFLVNPQ